MKKTIKVVPHEPTYYKRRKVLYYICEETTDDVAIKAKRLKAQAEKNKKTVIRISSIDSIKYYDSVKEAAEASGISYSSVSKCINGKQASAGGYEFKRGE